MGVFHDDDHTSPTAATMISIEIVSQNWSILERA